MRSLGADNHTVTALHFILHSATAQNLLSVLLSLFFAASSQILYGHAGGVTGVCWVPGSSRVLSVGEDRSVLEWEAGPAGGSAPVARMDHVHEDAIIAVVVGASASCEGLTFS